MYKALLNIEEQFASLAGISAFARLKYPHQTDCLAISEGLIRGENTDILVVPKPSAIALDYYAALHLIRTTLLHEICDEVYDYWPARLDPRNLILKRRTSTALELAHQTRGDFLFLPVCFRIQGIARTLVDSWATFDANEWGLDPYSSIILFLNHPHLIPNESTGHFSHFASAGCRVAPPSSVDFRYRSLSIGGVKPRLYLNSTSIYSRGQVILTAKNPTPIL